MGQALSAVITPRQQGPAPSSRGLEDAELPLDRDLSLIAFHRRVFDEARDEANPLLERAKFLGIVGTIINEFAVTRYAELAGQQRSGSRPLFPPACHVGVSAHLKRIETEITLLLAQARLYLREQLAPELARKGLHLLDWADLQPKERAEVESCFTESILPLLMPLGFDAARPFPHITGRTTALAAIVRSEGEERFACLQVPEGIPALVPFHWRRPLSVNAEASPSRAALEQGFVWLDEVISEHLAAVFPETEIVEVHPFRVLRDAGLDMEVSDGVALPDAITQRLWHREFGDVLALIVGDHMPLWLVELLRKNLGIPPGAVHSSRDLTDLAGLVDWSRLERPDLHDPPLTPRVSVSQARRSAEGAKAADIFASIREGDILLHHPYESFQPVIDFVERAACDPDVLAISTTLYRAGRHSPIVDALLAARRAGKQVRVVVELRARFDEENNIGWARALRDAGAHVVYGMIGFKVHAKLTLVVRREAGRLRRYVHLSSGNYNPVTSNVYTDLGLFSCHEDIASDATHLFNVLTGYGSPSGFRTLLVAPLTLRRRVKELIEREAAWARQGRVAHMILKMNALADQETIDSLYSASQAGVRIDLIVRGICCLRPGVPGVSDNIRVLSIVGRFLEHSRAWYFHNGGQAEIYIGSADLMPRNLDQRVEVMARLEDDRLKQRVRQEILATYLADNVKARELMPDGSYVRVGRQASDAEINSQECLL